MALSIEEFEKKCIELIEQIVLVDINQDRKGAVAVAERMLEKAKAQNKNQDVLDIFEKVVEEFKTCTDVQYSILKKQIFDI